MLQPFTILFSGPEDGDLSYVRIKAATPEEAVKRGRMAYMKKHWKDTDQAIEGDKMEDCLEWFQWEVVTELVIHGWPPIQWCSAAHQNEFHLSKPVL